MAVVNRWSAASCSIRAFWAEGRWRRLPQWRSSRWRVQPASADGEGLERFWTLLLLAPSGSTNSQ